MTPVECQKVRDLVARNIILEAEVRRLRAELEGKNKRWARERSRLHALLKASCTMRRQAKDESKFLHGLLLRNGIQVQR